jgi:hypothetical protein
LRGRFTPLGSRRWRRRRGRHEPIALGRWGLRGNGGTLTGAVAGTGGNVYGNTPDDIVNA